MILLFPRWDMWSFPGGYPVNYSILRGLPVNKLQILKATFQWTSTRRHESISSQLLGRDNGERSRWDLFPLTRFQCFFFFVGFCEFSELEMGQYQVFVSISFWFGQDLTRVRCLEFEKKIRMRRACPVIFSMFGVNHRIFSMHPPLFGQSKTTMSTTRRTRKSWNNTWHVSATKHNASFAVYRFAHGPWPWQRTITWIYGEFLEWMGFRVVVMVCYVLLFWRQ